MGFDGCGFDLVELIFGGFSWRSSFIFAFYICLYLLFVFFLFLVLYSVDGGARGW